MTQRTDAQAALSVRLVEGDKQLTARGTDPDTLVASARACVATLEQADGERGKVRPDTPAAS